MGSNGKKIFILAGAGGVGKNTILNGVLAEMGDTIKKIVSYTTREKRYDEIEGWTYHYITDTEFREKMARGEIFEHTEIYGYCIGMCKKHIDEILRGNYLAIKDADIIGTRALQRVYPNKVVSIFIAAEKNKIEERLTLRGDDENHRNRRLADYEHQIEIQNQFDYVVENNGNINDAIEKVCKIIKTNI